jgi:phage terminase large subunit-like protein
MALVDELHVVTDDSFEAMSARAGKRDRSLLLAISTPPPAGDDGVMRRLVDHGREGADPSFHFREFAAPAGCQVDDEAAWEIANPALDDLLHRDALRATLPPKMRENAFRRYRLGQWVGADAAWLPDGAWAACVDATRSIPDGAEVVVSFDGWFNGDTTCLVVAGVDQRPHLDLVELWEAAGHQVPIVDVEAAIRQACRRWRVLEIAADPFRWARSLQLLDAEGLPVLEYPRSPGRMTPATARFYEAVVNGQLTHSGDSRLARHMATPCSAKTPEAPAWPRSGGTHPGGSTPPWPRSWPMTGPPPWPV